MQRVNLNAFYYLGKAFGQLRKLKFEDTPSSQMALALAAKGSINYFLDAAAEMGFPLSKAEAKGLETRLDRILDERVIELQWVEEIKRHVLDFEMVFRREALRVSAFRITPKGIYDIEALIERPEERFSEKVRKRLPAQSLYDFREAGKCLAFDCATAAGFHTLRGTEALIIRYYEVLAGQAWNLSQRDWGVYIRELKNLNAPDAITQRLDEIRRFERNPILHPENNVEPDKALPLFEMVGGVVVLMVEEIEKLETAK